MIAAVAATTLLTLWVLLRAGSAQAKAASGAIDSLSHPTWEPSRPLTLDVPILMYHLIGGQSRSRYDVPAKDFAAQMQYLAQHGYTTVSVDQIAAALRSQAELPPCPIAITFDDGYRVTYENALPILQQYGFHATSSWPNRINANTANREVASAKPSPRPCGCAAPSCQSCRRLSWESRPQRHSFRALTSW